MTFSAIELSKYSGKPIELVIFNREGVSLWRYTSASEDVELAGNVFTHTQLVIGDIEVSQDVERTSLEIRMPSEEEFPKLYIAQPPSSKVTVEVQRYHFTDDDAEVVYLWRGRVTEVEHLEYEALITCEPITSSLNRPTLRRFYQRNCPHVLYGSSCKLGSAAWEVSATLGSVSGVYLTASVFASYDDGYFSGGFVELTSGGLINRAFVIAHVGDTVTLSLTLSGAVAGSSVKIYPGCDHSIETCNSKFSNLLNFGGFPYIPTSNPMGGTLVF